MSNRRRKAKGGLAERLWSRIRRDEKGCWLWTGAITAQGYGSLRINYEGLLAHRVMFELLVEPIPDGLHLDHLCRVRACCNPAHLEPVTCGENLRRSPLHNANKQRCARGHEYDHIRDGRRRCSLCNAINHKASRERERRRRAA